MYNDSNKKSVQCRALHTSPPNAGTLLIYDGDDKQFYNLCCAGNVISDCELFYERRQPSNTTQYTPLSCCGESLNL